MSDFSIINLRIYFVLFLSAQYSNAYRQIVTDPDEIFAQIASIHSMFVQEPHQSDFYQLVSTGQMFLALHKDMITLSFYEPNVPYTLLTFPQKNVDFELLHAETMAFSVEDETGVWRFRCIFSADRDTMDTMFSYLSACTGSGAMVERMGIELVECYVKMEHMEHPVVEAVRDIQPAKLYDQHIKEDGNFGVFRARSIVVLEISTCNNSFYIFYFRNAQQAKKFVRHLAPYDELCLPADVQSYVNYEPAHTPTTTKNKSESDSERTETDSEEKIESDEPTPSRSRPDERSSRNAGGGRNRMRASFTDHQVNRLRQEFSMRSFQDKVQRRALAAELGLQPVQVRNWFQNERDRVKKEPKT